MNMTEWAKKEIEIASKNNTDEYYLACCKSALKAFNCLMNDGHSGMSIEITRGILNRLVCGRPLSPIEDTEDIWNNVGRMGLLPENAVEEYQCKRMSSLFKTVYNDGSIRYHDVDRIRSVNINNENLVYSNGFITRLYEAIDPIKMPYAPYSEYIKVYTDDFLYDPVNGGDFDTMAVLHALKPSGEDIIINRFFKEGKNDWEEISIDEYNQRKLVYLERVTEHV